MNFSCKYDGRMPNILVGAIFTWQSFSKINCKRCFVRSVAQNRSICCKVHLFDDLNNDNDSDDDDDKVMVVVAARCGADIAYKQKFRFCGAPFIFLAVVSWTYCFCIWCEQKLSNNKDCTVLYTKLWSYQNSWLNYSSSITTILASLEFMSAYKWKWKTKHNFIFSTFPPNIFGLSKFVPKKIHSFENLLKNGKISSLIAALTAWVPFSFSPIHMTDMYTQPYFGRIKYRLECSVWILVG